jgi:3-hydroxyisobutyrate dehydrogenase
MQVAVLGMGRMGHALAERLLAGGHTLTIWNRTPGRANDLLARSARQAASPAQAAASSDLTLTSLADDSAVRSVVTGPDGAAAGLGGHGVLADTSTVSPRRRRNSMRRRRDGSSPPRYSVHPRPSWAERPPT